MSSDQDSASQPKRTRVRLGSVPLESETPESRLVRRMNYLPYEGERFAAETKRFHEPIVFVHHYGGSKRTLIRHIKLANQLGFDAVAFSLLLNDFKAPNTLPMTPDFRLGARHVWAEQIAAILNQLGGKKIVFSLSMPTNSVFEALADREATGISAVICDGGPFLQLKTCVSNLYRVERGFRSRLLLNTVTKASLAFYGHGLEEEAPQFIECLPEGLPVLSLRGENDPLVPASAIDDFFASARDLAITKHEFQGTGHVNAVKMAKEEYAKIVGEFLERVGTKI